MLWKFGVLLSNCGCYTSVMSKTSQICASWDTYWQGTGDVGAYASGGVSHPGVLAFWDEFFHSVKRDYTEPEMIDLASGNGAVIERALAVYQNETAGFTCLDASESAIANIRSRFPQVKGMVANAGEIPFDNGRFDIVTSQFGVEYAGRDAIDEAARLLAAGGHLGLLLHNESGAIHQECLASLDAIVLLQKSHFLSYAHKMFDAGFKAVRGADRAPYETAAKQLAPAIEVLEGIMAEHGQGVAGDTIVRLYSDVAQIHQEMPDYEPDEVLGWLERMESELLAYAGRMTSMAGAAINSVSFKQICDGLVSQGFDLEHAAPLVVPDTDLPLAWALVATRN